jgi:hypothetical protein
MLICLLCFSFKTSCIFMKFYVDKIFSKITLLVKVRQSWSLLYIKTSMHFNMHPTKCRFKWKHFEHKMQEVISLWSTFFSIKCKVLGSIWKKKNHTSKLHTEVYRQVLMFNIFFALRDFYKLFFAWNTHTQSVWMDFSWNLISEPSLKVYRSTFKITNFCNVTHCSLVHT